MGSYSCSQCHLLLWQGPICSVLLEIVLKYINLGIHCTVQEKLPPRFPTIRSSLSITKSLQCHFLQEALLDSWVGTHNYSINKLIVSCYNYTLARKSFSLDHQIATICMSNPHANYKTEHLSRCTNIFVGWMMEPLNDKEHTGAVM